jgi:basic amino acid/polyamine antiporter, APA family
MAQRETAQLSQPEASAAGGDGFQRKLGLLDASFLCIGGVLGSGIFMTSGYIAASLSSPLLFLTVWLIGGGITLCGALTFGELGALFPRAGGPYVYIREAYGLGPAFLYGWAFFGFIECGAIATLAAGFAEFFGSLIPALSTKAIVAQAKIGGYAWTLSAGQLAAVSAIIILTVVNCFGLKLGMIVQNLLTGIRIGSILVFIVAALAIGKVSGIGSMKDLCSPAAVTWPGFKALGLALVAVFWTYDGWYSVNCAAGEVRRPGRIIPLSLFMGTTAVTLIYLLVNIVYLRALPIESMSGVAKVGELAAVRLFGSGAAVLFAALIMMTILGCLNTTILYGPRVYYAMAEDGVFFPGMGELDRRFSVPIKGFTGQAGWSIFLCLSGGFQALYEYVVFALLLFFAATGASVIILRRKYPAAPREYKVWGYPLVPLVFIATTLAIFVNTLITQPKKSLLGSLLLAAGGPAYVYWRKGRKPRVPVKLAGNP